MNGNSEMQRCCVIGTYPALNTPATLADTAALVAQQSRNQVQIHFARQVTTNVFYCNDHARQLATNRDILNVAIKESSAIVLGKTFDDRHYEHRPFECAE